jgi:hypothetical protein
MKREVAIVARNKADFNLIKRLLHGKNARAKRMTGIKCVADEITKGRKFYFVIIFADAYNSAQMVSTHPMNIPVLFWKSLRDDANPTNQNVTILDANSTRNDITKWIDLHIQ